MSKFQTSNANKEHDQGRNGGTTTGNRYIPVTINQPWVLWEEFS